MCIYEFSNRAFILYEKCKNKSNGNILCNFVLEYLFLTETVCLKNFIHCKSLFCYYTQIKICDLNNEK